MKSLGKPGTFEIELTEEGILTGDEDAGVNLSQQAQTVRRIFRPFVSTFRVVTSDSQVFQCLRRP